MEQHAPFSLPPLPYPYDALLSQLDERTLHFHHDKHFAAYVDNLNRTLDGFPAYQTWSLEQLCGDWTALPESIRQSVRNHAGGVYNHDLYFRTLAPTPATSPSDLLQGAVTRDFGDLQSLKSTLKAAALRQFGSGWAWLVSDADGRLSVRSSSNQDTPLPLHPLTCCDVWEHAYYLQYQNRRSDYFESWWQLLNWPQLTADYVQWMDCRPRRPQP